MEDCADLQQATDTKLLCAMLRVPHWPCTQNTGVSAQIVVTSLVVNIALLVHLRFMPYKVGGCQLSPLSVVVLGCWAG